MEVWLSETFVRSSWTDSVVEPAEEALEAAVGYVAGMTDRYACQQAIAHLGWDRADLPEGIDVLR